MATGTAALVGSSSALERWLVNAADARDLTIPLDGDDAASEAVLFLAATLAGEFVRFSEIISLARRAVVENAAALRAVVAASDHQRQTVRAGSDDVARAGAGAVRVAEAAAALQRFASEAAAARDGAQGELEETVVLLHALEGTVSDAHRPIERMTASVATVRDFVATLERIARHARLLSVNATIEAAHLGSISRFGIVASEIRRLADSTHAASQRVRGVASEWHESTARVEEALAAGADANRAARTGLGDAAQIIRTVQDAFATFSESVATVAVVSNQQQAAFDSVAAAVGQIADRADEAARAATVAASLELDAYLASAERSLAKWTCGSREEKPAAANDDLSGRIMALARGEAATATSADPQTDAIFEAATRLVERANEDQRAILADIAQASMTVAKNLVAWRMIASSFGDVRLQIDAAERAVEEATAGARTAVSMSEAMRATFAGIGKHLEDAALLLSTALATIDEISSDVIRTEKLATAMSEAAERARTALAFIADLSTETDLLSLNAAIEASRAGSRGRSFAVIAGEVRRLASTTHEATAAVGTIVSDVASIGTNVAQATSATRESADATSAGAANVHTAVEELQASFTNTMQHATDVATIAGMQASLLDGVLRSLRDGARASANTTSDEASQGRIELLHLYSRAHNVAAPRSVAAETAKLRALNERTAERFEAIIESAVASGKIPSGAFDDFAYTELVGADVRRLGRLFDVSRVPSSGFSPPKYMTAWDSAIDETLIDELESALTDRSTAKKIMCAFVDLNGFVIANPRSKIAGWTGDPQRDVVGNRIKRFLEDDFTLSTIRFGLRSQVVGIGRRATYDAFRRAGCQLERPEGERPWKVAVSARDLGDVFSDLLTAVYVRGKRLGTIRLGYDPSVI